MKGFFEVINRCGLRVDYEGVSAWACNYVPNMLRTGNKRTRSSGSLQSLYLSLVKSLKMHHGLVLSEAEDLKLDAMVEGVRSRYPASAITATQKEEVTAADIDIMYERLQEWIPETEKQAQQKMEYYAALQTALVQWQGVFRGKNLRDVIIRHISRKALGNRHCWVIRYRNNKQRDPSKFNVSVIPKRNDGFDAYYLVKDMMRHKHSDARLTAVTQYRMSRFCMWASGPDVLNKKITEHCFRVGGHCALKEVCDNQEFVSTQGGWTGGISGGSEAVYNRTTADHIRWAAAMGTQ